MEYLFNKLAEIKQALADRYIFLFLDFDGTLAPIAKSPGEANLSQRTRAVLKALSVNPRLEIAIISGRMLVDIKQKVGLKNVVYVGNHGLEIAGPKVKFTSPVSLRQKKLLRKIKEDLRLRLSFLKGVIIEDKGLSLAVHFRLAPKAQRLKVKTIFHETLILYLVKGQIELKKGKMVLEVGLPVDWDKGRVVLWLLGRQQFTLKGKGVVPVYIGDDLSDEDAFKALRNKGLTIFVGAPKESQAQYYLRDTQEVRKFLQQIQGLVKSPNPCRN